MKTHDVLCIYTYTENSGCYSALEVAVLRGHSDVALCLLQNNGLDCNGQNNNSSSNGQATVLHMACSMGNLKIATEILHRAPQLLGCIDQVWMRLPLHRYICICERSGVFDSPLMRSVHVTTLYKFMDVRTT